MSNRKTHFVAATLVASFAAASAQAVIVFSDDFTGRTAGNHLNANGTLVSSWGTDNGPIGQTYLLAPTSVTEKQQHTVEVVGAPINSNAGVLRLGVVAANYNFHTNAAILAAGGFTLDFDFKRAAAAGFTGVFFGAETSDITGTVGGAFGPFSTGSYSSTVEAGYLFQNNNNAGRVQAHSKGVNLVGNIDSPIPFDDDSTGTVNIHHAKVTVLAPSGFGVGSPLTYSLSIDGVPVTAATIVTTSDGGFGSIGFSSNQTAAIIDNIVVNTIPEPTSLAALALGGFAALRRRRV